MEDGDSLFKFAMKPAALHVWVGMSDPTMNFDTSGNKKLYLPVKGSGMF